MNCTWKVTLTKGFTPFVFKFKNGAKATEFLELALEGAEKAELEMDEIVAKIEILEEK